MQSSSTYISKLAEVKQLLDQVQVILSTGKSTDSIVNQIEQAGIMTTLA